jgi:hypothetical protein
MRAAGRQVYWDTQDVIVETLFRETAGVPRTNPRWYGPFGCDEQLPDI